MLRIEPEEEYVVCSFDGEYFFTKISGKNLQEYFRKTTDEIKYVFKKSDAIYEE